MSHDPSLIDPLVEELLRGKVTYVLPIRQQLRPAAAQLTDKLRSLLRNEKGDPQWRFRAALALADYLSESEASAWSQQDLEFVAEQLVSSNAEFQPLLREALRPMHARLLNDVERIFADENATVAQRLSAANALEDYARDDIARLTQLLAVATPEQYAVLYQPVASHPAASTVEDLARIAATPPAQEMGSIDRTAYGRRRANAAVTLLRLGEPDKAIPVFEVTDDPEALAQFIFRCRPREVGVEALLDCLVMVSDAPVDRYPRNARYALLLALGEFQLDEIPESRRTALVQQLTQWYRHDPSSGVHGAAGWLLRHWGQTDIAREVDQTEVPYSAHCEWFTRAIMVTPTPAPRPEEERSTPNASAESEPTEPSSAGESPAEGAAGKDETGDAAEPPLYPASEPTTEPLPEKTFYYTFIVFPADENTIGSVPDESERIKNEIRHAVKLTRSFALLDREITFEELITFRPQYAEFMQQRDAKPADAGYGADWYDSVAFCHWLGQQSRLLEPDQAYAAPQSLDIETYPREPDPVANRFPRDWPVELSRRGFRLPTEAEWEVACRAGSRTAYGYGSDANLLPQFGWFVENSDKHVHPPRELRPSVRGIFDLHGNLFEWTHDWYSDFDSELVTDPVVSSGGSLRVGRGGSWSLGAAGCRAASRDPGAPSNRAISGGFRLALSPSGVTPEAAEDK